MKDWRKVKAKIKTQKEKMINCIAVIDTTARRYIENMCKKGCKFYEGGCKKNRYMKDCARKGLKNRD